MSDGDKYVDLHEKYSDQLFALQDAFEHERDHVTLDRNAEEAIAVALDACCPWTLLHAMFVGCSLKALAHHARGEQDGFTLWFARAERFQRLLDETAAQINHGTDSIEDDES